MCETALSIQVDDVIGCTSNLVFLCKIARARHYSSATGGSGHVRTSSDMSVQSRAADEQQRLRDGRKYDHRQLSDPWVRVGRFGVGFKRQKCSLTKFINHVE